MPQLPTISGSEARTAFEKDGWIFRRQRGSHMILTQPGHIASLSIPDHKELAKGDAAGIDPRRRADRRAVSGVAGLNCH